MATNRIRLVNAGVSLSDSGSVARATVAVIRHSDILTSGGAVWGTGASPIGVAPEARARGLGPALT